MASKTYAKATTEAPKERIDSLPTDRPVAVYYRQSSEGQIGNESTQMQQQDLPAQLVEMGWAAESIIPINDDQAVSGTLDIHERIGMSRLTDLIRERQIGAVAIVSENRAFRDQYQDQAAIFARLCAENHVIVVVPNGNIPVYRFHDPALGDLHRELFLRAAKDGFNFIQQHIRGKMLAAKKQRSMRGLWTGGAPALGYMVDLLTKRLVPFAPAVEVIRTWFALLLTFEGNVTATARHIRQNGPYLPDFDSPDVQASVPKTCHLRKPWRLKKRDGHFYPTSNSLSAIFTNVVYIGWFVVGEGKGDQRHTHSPIRGNHPPIVDELTFWAAFNYLSRVTPDGEPNPNYTPPRTTRPKASDDPARDVSARPFLEGRLYTPDQNGNLRPVGVSWNKRIGQYEYQAYEPRRAWGEDKIKVWGRIARDVDDTVHDILAKMFSKEVKTKIANKIKNSTPDFQRQREHWNEMIRQAEKELAGAKTRWENSTLPELVQEAEAAYRKIKNDVAVYQAKLEGIDALEADHGKMLALHALLVQMQDYQDLSLENKNLALQMLVSRVEVSPVGADLQVAVIFHDDTKLTRTISTRAGGWTEPDCWKLIRLGESGAPGLRIAANFRDRSWNGIRVRYQRLTGKLLPRANSPIRPDETFLNFLDRQSIEYRDALNSTFSAQASTGTLDAFFNREPEEICREYMDQVIELHPQLTNDALGELIDTAESNAYMNDAQGITSGTFERSP